MHAVVARMIVNDLDTDLDAVRGQLVPQLSQAPGFVTGFWTRKGNTGLSMIVFDSEDAANAATERLRSGMSDDVATLEDIEVREVIAHA
jgi:hypothetical protein